MINVSGNIRKMHVAVDDDNHVRYTLPVGEHLIDLTPFMGKPVSVTYQGQIHCVYCGSKTKKSFNQGYCYRCLTKLARCDSCIIKPELCHYHEGSCREPEWGEANCLNDHFVYLANTGTLKVGITRHVTDGVSSRWLDQGATQAMPILRVKNRRLSGLVEEALKPFVADKTNWRKMLKEVPQPVDLAEAKQQLLQQIEPQLARLSAEHGVQAISEVNAPAIEINYPVEHYPEKIKSINLDKEAIFSGTLNGIKGQYWMLDDSRVINMRKYAGYNLHITLGDT